MGTRFARIMRATSVDKTSPAVLSAIQTCHDFLAKLCEDSFFSQEILYPYMDYLVRELKVDMQVEKEKQT